ncbi:MAG: hypothetical protein HQK84_12490, partial [Nitrospinae bacterium]|nr:hypothetical protein [Nitrospinota bacterium]
MKKQLILSFFLFVFSLIYAPHLKAMSMGTLVVSQGDEGKFLAQLSVNHAEDQNVTVEIASEMDYSRLGVKPPPFLKNLFIKKENEKNKPNRSYFIIYSNEPLHKEEFSLALKALSDGGAILKNFEVVQTAKLSLSLKKDEAVVELLRNNKPQTGDTNNLEKAKKQVVAFNAENKHVRTKEKSEQAVKGRKKGNEKVVTTARKALKKKKIIWVSTYSGFYGPTKGGETPYKIAKDLNIPPALMEQAQNLLIQDNPNILKEKNNFIAPKGRYL